jgi:hypothetical protein
MANLYADNLTPINSWAEAVLNSKGYSDESLVADLIEQFKTNALERKGGGFQVIQQFF